MAFLRLCCQRRGIKYGDSLTESNCIDIGLQLHTNKVLQPEERRTFANQIRNQLYFMVSYPPDVVDKLMYDLVHVLGSS